MKTPSLLLVLAFALGTSAATAQRAIYSYAVGNWRNGPIVEISPLFGTTEKFTSPELIAWVRQQWPTAFTDTTDIDVQVFVTKEEGDENRAILGRKYGMRKLKVNMIESPTMLHTPASPVKPAQKAAAASPH